MRFIDVLGLCLSVLGIYGLILYLRYLLPYYVVPLLSALLNETQQLLDRAEALSAIPLESEYRTQLGLSANQLARMRMESNHAPGTFQQLRLAVQRGLTCKLFALYYRIEDVKSRLEVALDEQQLTIAENASSTAVPSPAAVSAIPANDVIPPSLPPPLTTC